MSTTIIFNDLTPEQIETVKAFAWAVKNESPTDVEFYVVNNEWRSKSEDQFFNIHSRYRIKPPQKLVPFDFSDAEKIIDKIVRMKGTSRVGVIVALENDIVEVGSTWMRYSQLLDEFNFINGSPCGKTEVTK